MDVGLCDCNVIATSERNMMSHPFLDSVNIYKKHVHEDGVIKSLILLRGIIQEAITLLSSQTSVEVDLALGLGR
jgi:hypothetical protein